MKFTKKEQSLVPTKEALNKIQQYMHYFLVHIGTQCEIYW